MLRILCTLPALVLIGALVAQGTAEDYRRADELPRSWRGQLHAFDPAIKWLPDGSLWYRYRDHRPRSQPVWCVRVAPDGTVRRAREAGELDIVDEPQVLPPQRRSRPSSHARRRTKVTFVNRLDRTVRLFWLDGDGRPQPYGELQPGAEQSQNTYVGHVWLGDFATDDLAGIFVAEADAGVAVFDAASRVAANTRPPRASRPSDLFVREHDVWWRDQDGSEIRLTDDGREDDAYRLPRDRSPDGTRALGFRTAPGEQRVVHLIESAPADQLQPKLQQINYQKPGDRIDRRVPYLFDLAAKRRIAIDAGPFADAWSIDHVRWSDDGKEVYCLYNRRGHQLLRIYGIDAASGAVRTVLEERSETFVDYSQKTWLHWLDGCRSLLWASERDGWNHLYHVDVATGELRQVTKGEWLVRKVERVDEEKRQIWFKACGIRPEQDPYHAHLARIDFDGGNLVVLTEGDGSHEWRFSPDGSLFVDRWSRVDQPWVTELRRSSDGKLVCELGRDDATSLLASGFRPPERFVAKGRDGTTDIHGILILPSNFDAARRYPVIEDIYAGPHDHFVQKQWGLAPRQRRLAELGFVVVQIDGMGTNWRSRAFHDVAWRNLKDSGFPDRIAWLRAAAKTRPWLDLTRVGIFGGSAGGQSALAALLHHGDFYQVAVADCGCHDNRMDKIWWNEAWMGWPIGKWYADNSNVTHAAKLTGRLLLTVGELDRNVDPSSTLQVVDALIRADKDFDFLLVPGAGHGVGETPYLVRRRQDFFVRHLLGTEPRR